MKSLSAAVYVSERNVVRLSGADRDSFLQGLITGDARSVDSGGGMRTLALTPKGKIVADFFVRSKGECLELLVTDHIIHDLLRLLNFYLITEKVTIETVPRKTEITEFLGAADDFPWLGFDYCCVLHPGESRIVMLEPLTEEIKRNINTENIKLLSEKEYESVRPIYGVAVQVNDFREMIPQEANLTPLISFTKGCFIGQEIVSRLEHKGRATRLLSRFSAETPLSAGAVIRCDGQKVGQITSVSTVSANGRYFALGICKTSKLEKLLTSNETALTHDPLDIGEFPVVSSSQSDVVD